MNTNTINLNGMNSIKRIISIGVIFTVFLLVLAANMMAQEVYVEPSSSSVAVNDTFNINITVSGTDLSGAEFNLSFNNTKLTATNVVLGSFFTSAGSVLTIPSPGDSINNDAGNIQLAIALTSGYASGTGAAAIITFKAKSFGISQLDLHNVKLTDKNINEIPGVTITNGTVFIPALIINVSSNLSIVLADNESTCIYANETCEAQAGVKTIRIKVDNVSVVDVPIDFSDSSPDFSGVIADSGNTTNGTGYAVVHFPNASVANKAGNKTLYVPVVVNSSLVCMDADATNVSAVENLLTNNCEGGEWVINPPIVEVPPGSGRWYYKITSNETSEVSGSGGGEGSSPIVWSSDSNGNEKNTFNLNDLNEVVYATGRNFTVNDDVCIYVVNDSNWNDGDPLTDLSIDGYDNAVTNNTGDLPTTDVWNTSLVIGSYDIVVDVDCDGHYNASRDAVDSMNVDEVGFHITPEPMAAMLFTIGMLAIYGFARVRRA